MSDVGVAVLSGQLGGVVFQGARAESHGVTAAAAQQVVAVGRRGAKPVEGLAVSPRWASAMCFSARVCRMR